MTGNTISGHVYTLRNAEEISAEISAALGELKKTGYLVTFLENQEAGSELLITFALGEAQQTIKIERQTWQKPGSVKQAVIDRLNI